MRARFDHVLVDEFQDTNVVQADIVAGLCGPDGNLTVVGDDAQVIYGFRAATVENIRRFLERWPGAAQVTLEQNYRSTAPILAAANAVLSLSDDASSVSGVPKPAMLSSDSSKAPVMCRTPQLPIPAAPGLGAPEGALE